MRTAIAAVLALSTLALPSADAQTFSPLPTLESKSLAVLPGLSLPGSFADSSPKERFWANVDYLWWWMKDAQSPPLLTAGNPADLHPGALGQPGTQVLFGGNQDYGNFNGMRPSVGGWFAKSNLGWEASGFLFERRSLNNTNGSDANGNPPLYVPIFRPDVAREGSITVAEPLDPNSGVGFNGKINVVEQFRLWGAEANLVYNLGLASRWRVNLLAGFRYLDLQESVTINTYRNDFGFDVQNTIQDAFATRSQFYGGQLGLKASTNWGKLSLDVTGKVALGVTHQTVGINGSDTVTGTGFGPTTTFNEGIFAQTSNIGNYTRNDFTVVPQVQVKLNYEIRSWLQASAGYDFLYWSRVVRAAEQIDHNVDLAQSNAFSANPPTSATFPQPRIDRTSFWAQGISVGLMFRY